MASITDGTSNSVMVGERGPTPDKLIGLSLSSGPGNGSNSGVQNEYQTGEDIDINWQFKTRFDFAAYEYSGDPCPTPAVFRPGKPDDFCSFNSVWSMHPGGANFLFADGHVRYLTHKVAQINPSTGRSILWDLTTRAGGELIPDY